MVVTWQGAEELGKPLEGVVGKGRFSACWVCARPSMISCWFSADPAAGNHIIADFPAARGADPAFLNF